MVAVNTDSDEDQDTAIRLLRDRGAQMIERADGSWHNGKWVDFDPVRPPDIIVRERRNDPAWERKQAMKRPHAVGRPVAYASAHVAPHAGRALGLYPGVARRRASADPDFIYLLRGCTFSSAPRDSSRA